MQFDEQKHVREQVYLKLKQAGWITDAKDISLDQAPNEYGLNLKFTKKGLEKLILLHDLISELGYGSGYMGSQFEFLWFVCGIAAQGAEPLSDERTPPPGR
jgi:hypothetical protein